MFGAGYLSALIMSDIRSRLPMCLARVSRPAGVLLTMLGLVLAAWLAPSVGRGQGPAAPLIRAQPFDRITLTDNTVLEVEPVSPRPLPAYDAKKDRPQTTAKGAPPREGNIFLDSQKDLIAQSKQEKKTTSEPKITEITVKPIGKEGLFKVNRANIKAIAYFEDLLLAEGEAFTRKRDFARAFDVYLQVRSRAPNWPGLAERVDGLLLAEGKDALTTNQIERGLRLLRELYARNPAFPGLADELGKAYRGRIGRAFEAGAYAEGRRVLHEFETLAPDHPVVKEARDRYTARARELVQKGINASGAERLDTLADALRVWPKSEEAARLFTEAFAAMPTLDVGVLSLPREAGPWVRSPADARTTRLVYLPLLAADDDDAQRGERGDQLVSELEAADLGRRLTLTLHEGRNWSGSFGPVSAVDVLRSLTDRANPDSPRYESRWALLMDRVEVNDPRRMTIGLARTVLRPASWLLGPVGPAQANRDGMVVGSDGRLQLIGDGPFPVVERTGAFHSYQTLPSDLTSAPGIRRLRERRYTDAAQAVAALRTGAVTLVEYVPPDQVAALAKTPELKIGTYSQPRVHVLVLDGRAPALRNRNLRRGISYAIDRKGWLEEEILHHASDETNRAADGVFPRGNYADAPGVAPLSFDPVLARMLVAAARRELGGAAIKLSLAYPPLPEARAVAPKLAEALREAGIELEMAERSESELEMDLRAGKRFDLAYRALTCREPITDAGPLICPGYDAPPSADALASVVSPRILELLLQLENASEFPSARGLVIQLDREVRDELPVVPLWQVATHYAWHSRLTGPTETADNLYDGIERWRIEAWYARDPW